MEPGENRGAPIVPCSSSRVRLRIGSEEETRVGARHWDTDLASSETEARLLASPGRHLASWQQAMRYRLQIRTVDGCGPDMGGR